MTYKGMDGETHGLWKKWTNLFNVNKSEGDFMTKAKQSLAVCLMAAMALASLGSALL